MNLDFKAIRIFTCWILGLFIALYVAINGSPIAALGLLIGGFGIGLISAWAGEPATEFGVACVFAGGAISLMAAGHETVEQVEIDAVHFSVATKIMSQELCHGQIPSKEKSSLFLACGIQPHLTTSKFAVENARPSIIGSAANYLLDVKFSIDTEPVNQCTHMLKRINTYCPLNSNLLTQNELEILEVSLRAI